MNEITLIRFIDDMVTCQKANRQDTKLRINLMEEEVEGFLEYPRLVKWFKEALPRSWEQLEAWFALPIAERNPNNTIFTGTTALNLAGSVEQPKRLVFFYVNGDSIMADTVNWISDELTVNTTLVGSAADAWVVGQHQSQPYEEIKTGYLIPIYLDGVAPGRNAELFKFLLTETLKVVDSDAGRAWYELTKERTDSFWESLGHRKFIPQ